MIATLHFAESAFPLHLLFERLQRLIDVVIADENLYQDPSPVTEYQTQQAARMSRDGSVLKRRRADSKRPRRCPLLAEPLRLSFSS